MLGAEGQPEHTGCLLGYTATALMMHWHAAMQLGGPNQSTSVAPGFASPSPCVGRVSIAETLQRRKSEVLATDLAH